MKSIGNILLRIVATFAASGLSVIGAGAIAGRGAIGSHPTGNGDRSARDINRAGRAAARSERAIDADGLGSRGDLIGIGGTACGQSKLGRVRHDGSGDAGINRAGVGNFARCA